MIYIMIQNYQAMIKIKILNIMDDYEFKHNIPTDSGSSGCPIILLNNNINLCQVIGIHKEADLSENVCLWYLYWRNI